MWLFETPSFNDFAPAAALPHLSRSRCRTFAAATYSIVDLKQHADRGCLFPGQLLKMTQMEARVSSVGRNRLDYVQSLHVLQGLWYFPLNKLEDKSKTVKVSVCYLLI